MTLPSASSSSLGGSLGLSRRGRMTRDNPITTLMANALANPGLVSLAAGFVDQASLPMAAVAQTVAEMAGDPAAARAALQYGTTLGYRGLREKVVGLIETWEGLSASELGLGADDVMITTGSQQMLYLLAEALLDEGDIVINSAPSYFVYSRLLGGFGARVCSVADDHGGLCPDRLTELLERLKAAGELSRVKLIYAVSYYQNPSGVSIAAERRERIVDLARRYSAGLGHRIVVLEDAAYRELRYDGPQLPLLKRYDPHNQTVVTTSTFSKPLAPGLKTGWTVMPRDLMAVVARIKGGHDFGSANFNQYVLERLLARGDYARQVEMLRGIYRAKRDAMLAALGEHFGGRRGFEWQRPDGGLYVWLKMPAEIDTRGDGPLFAAALSEGVLYVPGDLAYNEDAGVAIPHNAMRLSFGVVGEADIRRGIARLAGAVDRVMAARADPTEARHLVGATT